MAATATGAGFVYRRVDHLDRTHHLCVGIDTARIGRDTGDP
jgi:hypothetical protein